ncbi:MAG: 50S ribosomal protein L9 [Patescibacteria group bacterium]
MKIILLQDVAKIGKKFDVKEVSNGYALNFLFPKKQARIATNQAVKELEEIKKKSEEEKIVGNVKLLEMVNKIKDAKIEMITKANEEGKLFAGIDTEEISKALQEKTGLEINSDMIKLEKPIKEIGEYKIQFQAGEKVVDLSLNIMADGKNQK